MAVTVDRINICTPGSPDEATGAVPPDADRTHCSFSSLSGSQNILPASLLISLELNLKLSSQPS